jgi:hypothetical protein
VDISLDLSHYFVGNPDEVRNRLTVDALIPKFTFWGNKQDLINDRHDWVAPRALGM